MIDVIKVIEHVAVDAGKAVAYPFTHTTQFIKVMETLISASSPVRHVIVSLVMAAEVVDVDAIRVIAEKGVILPDDVQTMRDAVVFFELFKNQFLPVVEQAYKELRTDVK